MRTRVRVARMHTHCTRIVPAGRKIVNRRQDTGHLQVAHYLSADLY